MNPKAPWLIFRRHDAIPSALAVPENNQPRLSGATTRAQERSPARREHGPESRRGAAGGIATPRMLLLSAELHGMEDGAGDEHPRCSF